jgi:hypothetical protein
VGRAQYSPKWRVLVWDCPSRTMNPTLSEEEIAQAYEEDPASARSEFGGEWREDIAEFVTRSLVDVLVTAGRTELLPRSTHRYLAGVDLSGGRGDSAALCIIHKERGTIVQDFIRECASPIGKASKKIGSAKRTFRQQGGRSGFNETKKQRKTKTSYAYN